MNNIQIRKEFEKIVQTLATSLHTSQQPVLVNWEGEKGSHSDKTAIYLEPALLPAPTLFVGFQQNARIYTGVFQVSVVYPANSGTLIGETIAQAIVDSPLWAGARPGGKVVQLTDAPYYGGVLEGGDANRTPCTIPYQVCA